MRGGRSVERGTGALRDVRPGGFAGNNIRKIDLNIQELFHLWVPSYSALGALTVSQQLIVFNCSPDRLRNCSPTHEPYTSHSRISRSVSETVVITVVQ